MSAAHELAEREFEVTVLEARDAAGGRREACRCPGRGRAAAAIFPASTAFVSSRASIATCRTRCAASRSPASATACSRTSCRRRGCRSPGPAGARDHHRSSPARARSTSWSLSRFLFACATELGISPGESAYFVDRLLQLLTTCEERRFAEYEHQSWWEFSGAQTRSAAYGKFLADGLTRTLVAAKAREMSARTGGYILLQLLFDLSRARWPGRPRADGADERRLDRPVARAPALAGGRLPASGTRCRAIDCADGRISGVGVVAGETPSRSKPISTSPRCRWRSCGCS